MLNKFIGIPFGDGRPSYNKCNCYGLVELFYRDHLGIVVPSLDTLSTHSSKVWAVYLNEISSNWKTVESPEFGDVVAMAHDMRHPNIVQHVGIYIGDGRVLHTLDKLGSHVTKLDIIKSAIKGYHRWLN